MWLFIVVGIGNDCFSIDLKKLQQKVKMNLYLWGFHSLP